VPACAYCGRDLSPHAKACTQCGHPGPPRIGVPRQHPRWGLEPLNWLMVVVVVLVVVVALRMGCRFTEADFDNCSDVLPLAQIGFGVEIVLGGIWLVRQEMKRRRR
jgi:hypothetical protein